MEACIRTRTHYLDITGEIAVFERAKSMHERAMEAGIMFMSGVGFDVVPTDCIALHLKNLLPDATHLKLAFGSVGGGLSHGTAITMAEGAGEPGAARVNGRIVPVPIGQKGMWVDFGIKKLFTMTIPWGDVSTAWHTTGIPDIEAFTHVKPALYQIMKWQWLLNPLLRTSWFRRLLRKRIDRQQAGPDDHMRASARSLAWAEVRNERGDRVSAWLSGPDVYDITAHAALIVAGRVKMGQFAAGYQTPAGIYGPDLVLGVPGVVVH